MDVGHAHAGIGQHIAGDLERALHIGGDQRLEIGPGDGMEGWHAAQFQPTRGLVAVGKLLLHLASQHQGGLYSCLVDLVAHPVLAALRQHPLGNRAVEIVAAQRRIAARRQHLEDALLQPQQGEIESTAAEVVDRVEALAALVQAVGQRRRRRFVDQAQHFQPGDAGGVAGRGACGIVEIGRNRDDGTFDRLFQRDLGTQAQGLQDLRRDLDRRTRLAADAQFHHVGLAGARLDLIGQHTGHRLQVGSAAPHQALH